MNPDRSLERELRESYLASAPPREPEHLFAAIVSTTSRTRPRPRWLASLRVPPLRYRSRLLVGSPMLRLAAILGATIVLLLSLVGGVIAGASFLSEDEPGPRHEAVFLRLEGIAGTRFADVIVVGVDGEGHERQIARLPGAGLAHDFYPGYFWFAGAVSPDGLLALPMNSVVDRTRDVRGAPGAYMYHWEIFDLDRPEAEPIRVADLEQDMDDVGVTPYYRGDGFFEVGASWGPGEQFVVRSKRGRVSFIDGRTGQTTKVATAGRLLPVWAADGSGVFIDISPALSITESGVSLDASPGERVLEADLLLRRDGSVVDAAGVSQEPNCRTRSRSGEEMALPSGWALPEPDLMYDLPRGTLMVACLAPDDSAIAYARNPGNRATLAPGSITGGVLDPLSGETFEIPGLFVGWLQME